ncbi:TIM barrel protein [Promicromonospora sp. MEB111]|uniref:hydroxypyruvate isomerase family protein n=1 Tax=Promicromonospora sp. MEB111 TaxID=3040301 RepID=UPI0025501492|nr:TIM barrel protein [Promicromonospora sp. MEB111]
MPRFAANVSLLFSEVPLPERFARARAAGFQAVECWWPFETPEPSAAQVGAFVRALDDAEVRLTGINLFAGDMPGGERGIVSHPGRADELAANLAVVRTIVEATGCACVNALYGQRLPGVPGEAQDEVATRNLRRAVDALGATVLVEPLTRGENGDYPVRTLDDALAVVDRVGDGAAVLFDAYHLHNNGADVVVDIGRVAGAVGHVQVADSPGRGEPGTGTIDFGAFFRALDATGYTGWVGCEYRPTTETEQTLAWLPTP